MADDDTDGDSGSDTGGADGDEETVVLKLRHDDRAAYKDPLGPVFTDADTLLAEAGDPLIAVGDIVTHHLLEAGRDPDLAAVDGLTERGRTENEVRDLLDRGDERVWNPAARLTTEALRAVHAGLENADPATVVVDGEEDLLTLAAMLAAPDGASVVYGQPGEGMVHVAVDDESRARARELFDRLEGDHERALDALGL